MILKQNGPDFPNKDTTRKSATPCQLFERQSSNNTQLHSTNESTSNTYNHSSELTRGNETNALSKNERMQFK